MVDSCFRLFKSKCFSSSSIKAHRKSYESIQQIDKNVTAESFEEKINFATSGTSIDSFKKAPNDSDIYRIEQDNSFRRPKPYLRSVSTTSDAMSSDEENLDVLFPLPHSKNHENERPLIEEGNQPIVANNGEYVAFFYTVLWW